MLTKNRNKQKQEHFSEYEDNTTISFLHTLSTMYLKEIYFALQFNRYPY